MRKGVISMDIVVGDILSPNTSSKEVFVCHQVNCMGVMGAGLARQIKVKYPEVFNKYREYCLSALNKGKSFDILGDIHIVGIERQSGYKIVNIFGQYGYGRGKQYTNYEALRRAFKELCHLTTDEIIRIPFKMGCGLGGGDWSIVSKIIEEELVFKCRNVEIWKLD